LQAIDNATLVPCWGIIRRSAQTRHGEHRASAHRSAVQTTSPDNYGDLPVGLRRYFVTGTAGGVDFSAAISALGAGGAISGIVSHAAFSGNSTAVP